VSLEEGELGLLSCNVQAFPRAQLHWFRRLGELESEQVEPGGRFAQVANLLLIRRLHRNDSGAYLCRAKNSAGEQRLELELRVRG